MGTLRMHDLTRATGMTPRGVRHYVKMGILPRPEGRGTGPVYTAEHLAKLLAARRLRSEDIPLRVIATRLRNVSPEELSRLSAPAPVATANAGAAGVSSSATAAANGERPSGDEEVAVAEVSSARNPTGSVDGQAISYPSERWERVVLLPGLELHVRADASGLVRRLAAEIHARYGA
ncbi:MAG: MerR family transcriptional regulator [Polyangiaceae bacterium]|nr:MerR family transcriptional regulator [Polyangiaceae bacterium]